MRAVVGFLLLAFSAVRVAGQSLHLSALNGSVPAPVVEPSAGGGLYGGLASLWSDPTANGRAVGAFFDVYTGTYSSVRLYHAVVAFQLGARWSAAFGTTEIANLFDTSLTNQDPTLSNLRARAYWMGLDATAGSRVLTASLGAAIAGDENVGDLQNSTVGRVHLRFRPFLSGWLEGGVHLAGPIGGSLPTGPGAEKRIDLTASRTLGSVTVGVSLGYSSGRLWRYSETKEGYGAALQMDVASRLALSAGSGRYATTFGASSHEWYRSAAASIRVSNLRLSVRYTDTELGLGSGAGIALGYEPRPQ